MLHKNLKWKWVVLYGIGLPTPYGIDEDTVATYSFLSHQPRGKGIWVRRKDFFTEQVKSIQNPRFVFNGN